MRRAHTVYSVYGQRAEGFAPVKAKLPADARVLGVISFDDPEASLWTPFGARRILHLCPADSAEQIRRRGIRYVLVSAYAFKQVFGEPFDPWLAKIDADVIQTMRLELRATRGPADWCLVRLRGP